MKMVLIILLIAAPIYLVSIDVSGHLTEDTVWSPDNNPYHVVDNIFVDAGVNLTILPGTEIFIQSAPLTCRDDFNDGFWFSSGANIAKMFWVDGSITAIGTETDKIKFTRLQNDPDNYWGNIYITWDADKCTFKHCDFEYSGGQGIYVGLITYGTVTFYSKEFEMEHCHLRNYMGGVDGPAYLWMEKVSITDNIFELDEDLNEYIENRHSSHMLMNTQIESFPDPLIAGNIFIGNYYLNVTNGYMVHNNFRDNDRCCFLAAGHGRNSYFFENDFINSSYDGILVNGDNISDSVYFKQNRFVGGAKLDIDESYFEIIDNSFDGFRIATSGDFYGLIANNCIRNTEGYDAYGISSNFSYLINNTIFDCHSGFAGGPYLFSNNIISSVNYGFYSIFDRSIYENSVFLNFNNIYLYPSSSHNPIFRNCILDFELPEECIDGGGNIWVDSLQAQEIFEDIENGDFHLIEGSLAIDAGFDTTDYYYPFDMEYSHRVWDGDGDGNAVIDIGAYEYNSPSWGGIEGVTYNPDNDEPVKYVMLKINNLSNQFTFSDSVGYFNTKLPAGIYDIYCYRVFYDDVIMYEVDVEDGEFTELQIPLFEQTGVDENGIVIPPSNFGLRNYPNPFNPATRISFNLAVPSKVNLTIYNTKGQKIKTLLNDIIEVGIHSVVWDGKGENNKSVSSGIYFYKLETDNDEITGRCVLVK